jgi:hypothetical protein
MYDNKGGSMKRILWILAFAVLSPIMVYPVRAFAVSYSVVEEQRDEKLAKGILTAGETVCLFQSGTADVKKTITIGDVLVVYREGPKREQREVGKIKILAYSGADYLKGTVTAGEIRPGDIAKKGEVASLVISSGDRCK